MQQMGRRLSGATDIALLALRLAAGSIMALHGWTKFDQGLANYRGFLDFLNLPLPSVLEYVIPTLELVGGILIVLGLITRVPALLLAIEMICTAVIVKLVKLDLGILGPQGVGGAEVDLLYLGSFIALLILGPGRISLDRAFGIETYDATPEAAAESTPAMRTTV